MRIASGSSRVRRWPCLIVGPATEKNRDEQGSQGPGFGGAGASGLAPAAP